MSSENNEERIRQAVEGSSPPLSPEVRKRALAAALTPLRRRPLLRTAIVVAIIVLLLAAAVYVVVRWLFPGESWPRRASGLATVRLGQPSFRLA